MASTTIYTISKISNHFDIQTYMECLNSLWKACIPFFGIDDNERDGCQTLNIALDFNLQVSKGMYTFTINLLFLKNKHSSNTSIGIE